MNGNDQFYIPSWAERELDTLKSENTAQELEALRAFFSAWQYLHSVANKPGNRRAAEEAAQALVDAADAVRMMRAPVIIDGVANAG